MIYRDEFDDCIKSIENEKSTIISGGAGEKLRNKYNSKNGVIIPPIAVYHFVVMDLLPNTIEVSAIDLKGKILDEFIIHLNDN